MKHILALFILLTIPSLLHAAVYNGIATSVDGQPIAGATVTVCSGWSDSLVQNPKQICTNYLSKATIYSNSELTTNLTNPFQADNSGRYTFFVTAGEYTVSVQSSGYTTYSQEESIGIGMPTPVIDEGGQVYNVKAYGAMGNGTTDDTAAIQAAYNAAKAAGGGTVYFPAPSSCYLVNSTINMTGGSLTRENIMLLGEGSGYYASNAVNPLICANTGNTPIFDITETSGLTFKNISASATVIGLSNPSEIGVISGRTSSGNSGQMDKFVDCTFSLPTHTSGTTKSYGLYYYGVELSYNQRDAFVADYPLTVTATNIYGLNSTLDPWTTGTVSEKGDSFLDFELDSAGLGPAATFDYTWDMKLTGHSFNFSAANPYPSGLYQYALDLTGANYNMDINWDSEEYPGFANIDLGLVDSQVQGTYAPGASPELHCVAFNDASSKIESTDFRINQQIAIPTSGNFLYEGQAIDVDNVSFACDAFTDCVNINVGSYVPAGNTAYWRDIRWSGNSTNQSPNVEINNLPIYGSISIPATGVSANSCTNLTTVGAGTTPGWHNTIELSASSWYGLILSTAPGTGTFSLQVCNPTAATITPPAGTVYWRVH